MIQEFVDRFMEKKPLIRGRFRQFKNHDLWWSINYDDIVRIVIESVTADSSYPSTPDPERIHEIDDGDYQGTLVYVIGEKGYQPDAYWYVKVDYGLCSGCDTLMNITECCNDDEWVLDDLMTLALHIVQRIKKMGDE